MLTGILTPQRLPYVKALPVFLKAVHAKEGRLSNRRQDISEQVLRIQCHVMYKSDIKRAINNIQLRN